MVSSSPTTAPAELSRLTSPARPELLVTVIVWVPVTAVDHSGAQLVGCRSTALAPLVAAAGGAAIVAPAASAGAATRTPATSQGRRPATRSQLFGAAGSVLACPDLACPAFACSVFAGAVFAGTPRPALTNAGMTTT